MTERQESIKETWQTIALWLSVFAGPLAWYLDQQAKYYLASYGCSTLGRAMLHIITVLSLALVTFASIYALRVWNQDGHHLSTSENAAISRQRFIAGMALMLSGVFILL
ncbi:MAG TPA: hypothetical protein VEF04_03645, partial [Blastocatellia bacterium]|nr:hypothetical protein [Blastocatellia bacterium]